MPVTPEQLILPGGYRLSIAVPRGDPPVGGWPVLWLLDGASLFPLVAPGIAMLSRRADATGVPPMLVVGLDHDPPDQARRTLDFSFGPATDPAGLVGGDDAVGGGADFLDLLTRPARAEVAGRWPVAAHGHLLLGHSLGGLFVVQALARRPGDFAAAGAISPSLWWDRPSIWALIGAMEDAGQALFIGAGEREEPETPATPAEHRRHARGIVRNARAAAAMATDRLGAGRVELCIAQGEDHASAFIALLPRFLRFAGSALAGDQARSVAPPST